MEELKIVAVKRSGGEIDFFKLNNGEILDRATAWKYVNEGKLKGYVAAISKTNEYYIRSAPDNDPSNNLSSLPEFR